MVIRPPGHNPVPAFCQSFRQYLGVLQYMLLMNDKLRGSSLLERYCLGGNDVFQRATTGFREVRCSTAWQTGP